MSGNTSACFVGQVLFEDFLPELLLIFIWHRASNKGPPDVQVVLRICFKLSPVGAEAKVWSGVPVE